jgi:hypothetical protein
LGEHGRLEARARVGGDQAAEGRGGFEAVLLSLFLLFLPFCGAGVLRAGLGVGFNIGAVLAALATVVLVAAAATTGAVRIGDRRVAASASIVTAVLGGLFVWALYPRAFDGLVTLGGIDAGHHVALQRLFVERDPGAQHGLVAWYALTYGLQVVFGFDSFESFRASYYAIVAAVSVYLVAACITAVRNGRVESSRAAQVALAILVALAIVAAFSILLPALHYHQSDGYFAHLFGLVPLLAGASMFAVSRSSGVRVLVLLGVIVAYRYSYGLNLGDLAATSAVLLALEVRGAGRIPGGRVVLLMLAAGALLAAVYAYIQLWSVLPVWGAIKRPGLRAALAGEVILTGMLLAMLLGSAGSRCLLGPAGVRLLQYAAIFGIVNVSAQAVMLALGVPREYYMVKYHLHGVVLTLCTAVAATAAIAGRVLGDTEREGVTGFTGALGMGIALGIAVAALAVGYGPYLPSFAERVRGTPPWRELQPLADREAWRRIERTLAVEGASFGGLLAPSTGLSGFMNAAFGYPGVWHEDFDRIRRGETVRRSGYCAFWFAGVTDLPLYDRLQAQFHGRLADAVRELNALPTKRCEEYLARWDPATIQRLCHVCEPTSILPSPLLPR